MRIGLVIAMAIANAFTQVVAEPGHRPNLMKVGVQYAQCPGVEVLLRWARASDFTRSFPGDHQVMVESSPELSKRGTKGLLEYLRDSDHPRSGYVAVLGDAVLGFVAIDRTSPARIDLILKSPLADSKFIVEALLTVLDERQYDIPIEVVLPEKSPLLPLFNEHDYELEQYLPAEGLGGKSRVRLQRPAIGPPQVPPEIDPVEISDIEDGRL